MRKASIYGAFNARWLTPEEIARTFVPIPQFAQLVQTQSSILMGPRGCGKTTLLKMLTREAQDQWRSVSLSQNPQEIELYPRPDFEAVYIPSDVRWSYELTSITEEDDLPALLGERVQRTMFSLAATSEVTKVFEEILGPGSRSSQRLAAALVAHWKLNDIVPVMSEIRLRLLSFGTRLRYAIHKGDKDAVASAIDGLPECFASHALEAIITACSVFGETAARRVRPKRWCLCFDELEIAPEWLQKELLECLRSLGDQSYLLKLTWSPVLPNILPKPDDRQARPKADYATIRVWHSHVVDAKSFCKNLSTRLIRDRLGDRDLDPSSVFGRSLFAAEERLGEDNDVYGKGSEVWEAMVELAARDPSFRKFLEGEGLDYENPVSDNTKKRDECLRKIKPIVLLRETFKKTSLARSRKRPTLYAGEEAIYAMSDGNPRWLAGLLNDLLDFAHISPGTTPRPLVPQSLQAQVLAAASHRMKTYIKSFPHGARGKSDYSPVSLYEMMECLGEYFRSQLLGPEFKDDPVGSFEVDEGLGQAVVDAIHRGLLIGAFIFVGQSPQDVASAVEGSRLRLSFMLCPAYHLSLRNYREIHLSSILNASRDPRQHEMFPLEEDSGAS